MLALPQVGKVVIITWLRGCLRLQNGHMAMGADNKGGTEAFLASQRVNQAGTMSVCLLNFPERKAKERVS